MIKKEQEEKEKGVFLKHNRRFWEINFEQKREIFAIFRGYRFSMYGYPL